MAIVVMLLGVSLLAGCGVKSDPVPYLSVNPPVVEKPVPPNPTNGVK